MKIGIDARCVHTFRGGITTYARNLIKYLAKIDKINTYVLFFSRVNTMSTHNNFKVKPLVNFIPKKNLQFMFLWEQFLLPIEMKKEKIDLFHCPGFAGPIIHPCNTIITLHDLTSKLFPEDMPSSSARYWNNWVISSVKKADRVITDSNHSKKDIMHLLGIPIEKIHVIPLAVDDIYLQKNHKISESIKEKYQLPDRFILYVGALITRKNVVGLVKAFYKLKKREGIKHSLVIVGGKGWAYSSILNAVRELNLQKDVIFLGYTQHEDLPALYSAAELFVYPSFYEGFGLPPLESMACETPVITSNTSSLVEVIGNAGIMVNPYDIDSLANAMHEVLTNDSLSRDMIKKGLERVRMFSWERVARETLEVYEEVFDEKCRKH